MHQAIAALVVGILAAANAQPPTPYHELLTLASSHNESRVRKGALDALQALHWKPTTDRDWSLLGACGPEALPLLGRLLESEAADKRSRCARVIAEIGKKKGAKARSIEILVDRGAAERDASVRKACAEGLVRLGWPANDKDCAKVFARRPVPWPLVDELIDSHPRPYGSPMQLALERLKNDPRLGPEVKKRLAAIAKRTPPAEIARRLLAENWRPASDDDWGLLVSLGVHALPLFDRYLAGKDLKFTVRAIEEMVNLVEREPNARAEVFARLSSRAFDQKTGVEVREAASAAIVALGGPANQKEMDQIVSRGATVLPLAKRLLESANQKVRSRGLECLARLAKADETLRDKAIGILLSAATDTELQKQALAHLRGIGWPRSASEFAATAKRNPKAWEALAAMLTAAKPKEAKTLCGILEALARGQDHAAAKEAATRLSMTASNPKATSARPEAIEALKRLAADPKFPRRAEILERLVGIARKNKTIAGEVADFLASQLDPKLEGPTRDAVLGGLAALGWAPASEAEEKKLVAIGPAALRVTERLVERPDPGTRKKALRIISEIAKQHQEARDVAFRQLARIAQDTTNKELSQEAVRVLRSMGWPRSDQDWADLAKLGAPAMPILKTLIADENQAVRARAAAAVADVVAKEPTLRPGAIPTLLRLVLLDQSAPVRKAAMEGLALRLGWPASDPDWALVEKLRCKALVALAWLARHAPDQTRRKARAKARDLCPALLAQAELRVDETSLLEGIELRWDLDSEDCEKKILALAGQNKPELVEVEFRRALDLADKTEQRVHALAITLSRWPLAGVADKWKALSSLLESEALEQFRNARKLTVANWRAMLRKRSADLATWHEAFERVAAGQPKAKLHSLTRFITANPQSYYARFAWKWKDILSR